MIAAWLRSSKIGVVALAVLLLGFGINFVLAGTVWNSFFDHAVTESLPFHAVQAATVLMLASAILALWGLLADKQRGFAIAALLALLPLFWIDALRTGW